MDINDILELNEKEQTALADCDNKFNCTILIDFDGKTRKYCFDDYRVAQAIANLLDNMRFVKKS